MMRRDLNDGIGARSHQPRIAALARHLLAARPRVKARPVRSTGASNMLASFGMIIGLLLIWALSFNM